MSAFMNLLLKSSFMVWYSQHYETWPHRWVCKHKAKCCLLHEQFIPLSSEKIGSKIIAKGDCF